MPTFKYKALRSGEQPFEATVEAKDRFEVYSLVRKENAQVLSVEEVKKSSLSLKEIKLFSRVSEYDKILFARNLSAMLTAGLSLSRALNVMERQARKPKLKEVLVGLQREIQQGGDLNGAMAKRPDTFPSLMIAMVKAGEESGSLADSLVLVADQTERVYELKKKIRGAMIYPSVIVFVLVVVGILMMIYIVPTLSATFRDLGAELPMSTKMIMIISDFLVQYTLLAILGLVGFIALCVGCARTSWGKRYFETFILNVPVIGTLVKETNSARTGRTLASLLSAGVHVVQAFEITNDVVQNTHYRAIIAEARTQVQKGSPIAEVFIANEKLYPPLVGELIAVGEETGNLPDMLRQIANYYEKEVDQKTKNMSTIIEPILMLVVGGAVGYFAVAMISPIYSISNSI